MGANETEPNRIVIADSEPLFLSAMGAALADLPGFEIVAAVRESRELLDRVTALQPRIILTGFVLACGRDALGMLGEIRSASTGSSLLVILPEACGFLAPRFANHSVAGLVSRFATAETLRVAVECVAMGSTYIDTQLVERHPHPDSTAGEAALYRLSSRELEIFRLLGSGRSYKEIASLLGISPRTVESHRTQIKTKLGIASANSLTLVARAYLLWESTGLDYVI